MHCVDIKLGICSGGLAGSTATACLEVDRTELGTQVPSNCLVSAANFVPFLDCLIRVSSFNKTLGGPSWRRLLFGSRGQRRWQ